MDSAAAITHAVDECQVVDHELSADHVEDTEALAAANSETVAFDSNFRCDGGSAWSKTYIRGDLDGIHAITARAGAGGLVGIGGDDLLRQGTTSCGSRWDSAFIGRFNGADIASFADGPGIAQLVGWQAIFGGAGIDGRTIALQRMMRR